MTQDEATREITGMQAVLDTLVRLRLAAADIVKADEWMKGVDDLLRRI